MNIQVFPVYEGPDLNGEILIETDRSVVTLSPEKVTFQIGHRSAEQLFGKLGPVLKAVKAALEQENPS